MEIGADPPVRIDGSAQAGLNLDGLARLDPDPSFHQIALRAAGDPQDVIARRHLLFDPAVMGLVLVIPAVGSVVGPEVRRRRAIDSEELDLAGRGLAVGSGYRDTNGRSPADFEVKARGRIARDPHLPFDGRAAQILQPQAVVPDRQPKRKAPAGVGIMRNLDAIDRRQQ